MSYYLLVTLDRAYVLTCFNSFIIIITASVQAKHRNELSSAFESYMHACVCVIILLCMFSFITDKQQMSTHGHYYCACINVK
jgi:hypothetical protein